MSQYKQIVTVSSADMTARIFGAFDANVRLVEAAFSVVVRNRSGAGAGEGAIVVEGADAKNVARAAQALENLRTVAAKEENISEQSVR